MRTVGNLLGSSVLCKDKLDSALIRLNREVQKYAISSIFYSYSRTILATNPCLDPDRILQKVNKKGQRIATVWGTSYTSEELQKLLLAFPADRLKIAQNPWITESCSSPPVCGCSTFLNQILH